MNTIAEKPSKNFSPPSATRRVTKPSSTSDLGRRFQSVRCFSEKICETLEPEDYVIQTMPEASPTKWHLAHTSWFFETFVLKQFCPTTNRSPAVRFLVQFLLQRRGPILLPATSRPAFPPDG